MPPPFTTFDTLLVANRGEVALRVIRTARALGLRTVAVYSDADRSSPHVSAADEAVRIGPAPAAGSYLSIPALLEAARCTGANAVHPGYGFLSEQAAFARAVRAAGLVFVGPSAEVMDLMGRKDQARQAATANGIPVVPQVRLVDGRLDVGSEDVSFPLLVKAVFGGGGKGMRIVRAQADLEAAVAAASREAQAAFGSGDVLLERYVEHGRHVEVQVIGDDFGTVVQLGDRDCSVQRRHQKVIEEAPASTIDPGVRRAIAAHAVDLARAVAYTNAGTVEFLVDGDRAYFLEMNTRLQVEHPVTELVCGVDLVELQLRVADAQPLALRQQDVEPTGHAIEARVYAEDPAHGFLPQAGTAELVRWPQRVRVDAALESGQEVGTEYDPMLGKIVARGPSRESARRALVDALDATAILGLATNLGLLRSIADSPQFRRADIHTAWLDAHVDAFTEPDPGAAALIAAWVLGGGDGSPRGADPFDRKDGWRLSGEPAAAPIALVVAGEVRAFVVHPDGRVLAGEREHRLAAVSRSGHLITVAIDGRVRRAALRCDDSRVEILVEGSTFVFARPRAASSTVHAEPADGEVPAPMPGALIAVMVDRGQPVRSGDPLGVLEAMKMEFTLTAPFDGTVRQVRADAGAQVERGEVLFVVEEAHQ